MGYTHFNEVKRMELSILRKKGYPVRQIASALGVSHSSVVRELKRNRKRDGSYVPHSAQLKAYVRRKYSKYEGMKLRNTEGLEDYVKIKLQEGWTPEQIAGRLKEEKGKTVVSFKGIYKWLYSVHGIPYIRYLPYRTLYRKKRKGKKEKRNLIPNRVWIEDRPEIVNERKRIGDFEGDTLGRPRDASPQTLTAVVDRFSRFLIGRKVSSLKRSMEEGFKVILPGRALSLTMDNGPENVRHESLGVPTYFCRPYHSWEKGGIENAFQRLRRWVPKRADLKDYSDERLASIFERMNNTPRKCLGFRTPAEVFKEQTYSSRGALGGTM